MVEVKEAAKKALQYFQELFQNGFKNVRLEEVEMSDDGTFWYITLGYDVPPSDIGSFAQSMAGKSLREFKTFQILAGTGELRSVKIRKV